MAMHLPSSSSRALVPASGHAGSRPASRAPSPAGSAPGSGQPSPTGSAARSRSPSPTKPFLIALPPANSRPGSSFLSNFEPRERNFNDSHMHPRNYRQLGLALPKYIAHMDRLWIPFTTLMPIPTSLKPIHSQKEPEPSLGICGCSPCYYLPGDMLEKTKITKADVRRAATLAQLYPDTEVDDAMARAYGRLTAEQKERLDPMITGLNIGADDCSNRLLEKLDRNPGVFTGVGEITVHKEVVDKLIGKGWARLERNIKPLIQLLHTCGRIGMPVVLHCDIGRHDAAPRDEPKYLKGMMALLAHDMVRETTIIWAHAGGLGRFVNAPERHVDTLRGMLKDERYRKLHIDISWTVVADKMAADSDTAAQWKDLIEEFPERFIFGSDTLAPRTEDVWNANFEKHRGLRASLAESTVKKVFLDNYERLFVQARPKVRDFERLALQDELARLEDSFTNDGTLPAKPPVVHPAIGADYAGSSTSSTSTAATSSTAAASQYAALS